VNSSSAKQTFLRIWDREFRTTTNVFRSFPEEAVDVKPHERSRPACDLVWQCVIDERAIAAIAEQPVHDLRSTPPPPPVPKTMHEIAFAYEAAHREAAAKVDSLTAGEFGRNVTSILKGGEWTMPQPDAFWGNLMDEVHHRGQLTLYLRFAGGKVPSIYGPSADQPVPTW